MRLIPLRETLVGTQARTDLLARTDPELLALQEATRKHAMYPKAFDTKTSQLMLFGMLLVQLADATRLHAIAARRAGWRTGPDPCN